jgi:hypothetical protein
LAAFVQYVKWLSIMNSCWDFALPFKYFLQGQLHLLLTLNFHPSLSCFVIMTTKLLSIVHDIINGSSNYRKKFLRSTCVDLWA